MSKFTEWFPATTRPVRKGTYQTKRWISDSFAWTDWDGKCWRWANGDRATIVWYWRGLAKPPAA